MGLSSQCSMEEGDIVLSIDGKPVTDFSSLETLEFFHDPSKSWAVSCWRGGKAVKVICQPIRTRFKCPSQNDTQLYNQLPKALCSVLPVVETGTLVGFGGMIIVDAGLEIARQMNCKWASCLPINSSGSDAYQSAWERFPYISCIMKGTPADAAGVSSGIAI